MAKDSSAGPREFEFRETAYCGKRVYGLPEQELHNSKNLTNVKYPELSKEFGDVIRFWLASIPTAAEAAEVVQILEAKSIVCGDCGYRLFEFRAKADFPR